MSKDADVQCDIETDLLDYEFTPEELELKEKNPSNYLKLIAEKLRVELFDNLQENMELHKLKEELKDEQQDLIDEKSRLLKLIEEANDTVNEFKEIQAGRTSNDSGIN